MPPPFSPWRPSCSARRPRPPLPPNRRRIAGPGSAAGQVERPLGVAVDEANGYLYVADATNWRIDKVRHRGRLPARLGLGGSPISSSAAETCGPEAGHPKCFDQVLWAVRQPTWPQRPGSVAPTRSRSTAPATSTSPNPASRRISKFTPTGEFLWMAGKEVNQGGGTPSTTEPLHGRRPRRRRPMRRGRKRRRGGRILQPPRRRSRSTPQTTSGCSTAMPPPASSSSTPPALPHPSAAARRRPSGNGLAVDSSRRPLHVRPGAPTRNRKSSSKKWLPTVRQFKLGNLPAACCEIEHRADHLHRRLGSILRSRIEAALDEACGTEAAFVFVPGSGRLRSGQFEYENVAQLELHDHHANPAESAEPAKRARPKTAPGRRP